MAEKQFPHTLVEIDDQDVDWIDELRWYQSADPIYPQTSVMLLLHDLIINDELRHAFFAFKEALKRHREQGIIDHKDRNPLNNRRDNLRYVSARVNMLNRGKIKSRNGKPPSSQYIGVTYNKCKRYKRPWEASVNLGDKGIKRKRFATEEEAARWRDEVIRTNFPELDNLNFNS